MPIYEYKCPKCGVVEVMQGIKEAPLKKCPNCRNKVERMISSTSFVLKGTGWYATDYGKKTSPPSETSSATNGSNGSKLASDSSKSADSSAAKSESKPAASEKPASSSKSSSSSKSE